MEAWKQYVGFAIGLLVLFLLFAVGMTIVPLALALVLTGLSYLLIGIKMVIDMV